MKMYPERGRANDNEAGPSVVHDFPKRYSGFPDLEDWDFDPYWPKEPRWDWQRSGSGCRRPDFNLEFDWPDPPHWDWGDLDLGELLSYSIKKKPRLDTPVFLGPTESSARKSTSRH
ncbi:hypothetical protein ACFX19_014765 [Malus domestica]